MLAAFAVENICLGLLSAVTAMVLAQIGSWVVCHLELDVVYHPFIGISFLMVLAVMLLVSAVGLGASRSIFLVKPALFLREQADE